MAPVTVIIPWRGGCAHRERARAYVVGRYRADLPDAAIALADLATGAWSKSRAVTPALRVAENGAVVVADADCWSDGIGSAIRAVTCGAANWTMPHGIVRRLDEAGTEAYIGGADPKTLGLERPQYVGMFGGGIVVAHRDTLLDVPLDPRFEGWGGEDESWALALQCLAGPAWRGNADLIHLWHPRKEQVTKHGSPANRKLRQRYGRAGTNPKAMRSLIEETHGTFNDDDQHSLPAGKASRG